MKKRENESFAIGGGRIKHKRATSVPRKKGDKVGGEREKEQEREREREVHPLNMLIPSARGNEFFAPL